MYIDNLKVQYGNVQKPSKLSDPHHDYGKRYLDKILAKEDSDLDAIDYRNLLNGNLPAGTFEEVAYYLPLSIYYLCLEFDDKLEMINSWVDFIYENKRSISKYFDIDIKNILNQVFNCLTKNFEVRYIDEIERKKLNLDMNNSRYVKNLELLSYMFVRTNLYDEGSIWIEKKIEEMKNGTVIQKKWLYELYNKCNEVFGLYLDDEMMLKVLDGIERYD
ncbi:hypothetical protein [Psychrobacter sp. HII-4]|uniref:hypothetical protein n=1 Tax=Psychrobacter sp. HII-4 TaxID=1569264 RepID=UPI00191938B9|nr:hypothetical protein [Psychrobacter sp. HII-4]